MRVPRLLAVFALVAAPLAAQQSRAVTAEDYARAEGTLATKLANLVDHGPVRPNWIDGGRFWYRNALAQGAEFILVDSDRKRRDRAFDHERLAAALARAADTAVTATGLTLTDMTPDGKGWKLTFSVGRRAFVCDGAGAACTANGRAAARGGFGRGGQAPVVNSPDGTKAAFIRANNLWVRDVASGQETQLTTDGQEDFGYATNNAGWVKGDNPVLVWSPDSKKIATFQHDGRKVGMMYLVNTQVGHPQLEAWKYPLPGDSAIFTIHRVIIDVEGRKVVRLKMAPDQHRSTICDHVYCGGTWADVEWYPDGSHVAFVSSSRDHKQANLRVADAVTGDVRDVLEEKVATQFESGFSAVSWRVLPASNEVLWYSERDDWGNLYLYDLATGALKRQITMGPGPVLDLIRVDEKARVLYFTGAGKEAGRDPYFTHLYRIGMDGKGQTLLTPEDANHGSSFSPDGRYFVDSYSTPTDPGASVLRDARGRLVLDLEKADISRLVAAGWVPPMPFTVKARDGKTDLYGLMYRPKNFDPNRKYPVVNYLYPGPQTGSVGTRNFVVARADKQAIAELGFVVVELDAMGTPMRSKSFHDAYYGHMGDNGLPDQVGGIKQLGAQNPWMDLDRVGIWGHSGGGFASTAGILRYPDFYKVAVSQAGNHDQRTYEDDWGERYQGLLERNPDGTDSYDAESNQSLVKNLKGKLLIAHGSMDNNVPPNNTMKMVDDLIRANKDFDLLVLPNRRHGFGNEPYMMRRRWDYFVRNLLGAEPPKDYEIGAPRPLVP
ncbi:MAG: DPP IV N-terminal domain-containing protein [Gemmatimonadales bacterium]